MTSDAGAMLLGATDGQRQMIERFADCLIDTRAPALIEPTVVSLVRQRVFGIALGYEDLIDHDQLRHDPVMAVLGGKLAARRADCAPRAGKSTLNRLELSRPEPTRYHKISYDGAAIEALFVDLFLDADATPPAQIVLDLDATDDPLHRHQEECFFHGDRACPRAGACRTRGTPTAICRFTYSAAGICWSPNCARPISMPVPAASKRSRGSSPVFAGAGRKCAFCGGPIRGLPARR